MFDPTSLLFGMDSFRVVSVIALSGRADLRVVIETTGRDHGCPGCGVISSRVKERPTRQVRDLTASGQRVELWWRARRLVCAETACRRSSFVERSDQIGLRSRLTGRFQDHLARSVAVSNRAVSEVGREHNVGWNTIHRALVRAAERWLPTPAAVSVLGIDETRARSVRWVNADGVWKRSNPWLTSFVDVTPGVAGSLLGLTSGRSGACVKDWLQTQTVEFRNAITSVVIDPSAPYASGIKAALPNAKIAVDHWHLVRLGNQLVTDVRQRVTRDLYGRRGLASDRVWAHRQMLLTAGERLSAGQLTRLDEVLDREDPTNEIGAAWAVKERLRMLLAERNPTQIQARLDRFFQDCADAQLPEATRLARTIRTWWPHIRVFLEDGVTNARTEGFNRIIKQVKRVGCGFPNEANYQRRILAHIAITRTRPITPNPVRPAQR